MTRILYLHAGPPKTGSTSIQIFFRDNAAVFARQGFYRAVTGTEQRSHYHLDLVDAFRPERAPSPLLDRLKDELNTQGLPERVFISAEHFAARLPDPAYLASLQTFCDVLGYRLHIAAYVRPQPVLLNSLYTQSVKSWRIVPAMEQFSGRELQSGRHDYLKHFSSVLHSSTIGLTLRPFNRAVLKRGLTADMCEVMGLDTKDENLVAPDDANVAPGPRTVAAFQRLRRRTTTEFPELDRDRLAALTWPLLHAAGALGWNDEKFGGIDPALHVRLKAHFRASNERLALRVWSKSWDEVFTEAESNPPPFNIFDPALAAPSERRAFRDFIEQSLEAIGDLAGIHHGQSHSR